MRRLRLVVGLTAVSIGLAFASDRVGDEAGKPDSDSPSATHEIRRDTNAEVPAPREAAGRRRASDSPGTAITFPFVRADERHTTLVVTINGTYDPLDVVYVGCEGRLGFSRQQADGSLVGKGSERVYLEQLFSHPERIDFLKVKANADVYGKFNLEQFVRDHDGRTASGFAFNSTQSPMHHLSMTYTPDDASWRRITLINAGDVAVDVYWRDSTGEERVLAPNLGLGRQFEYDFPGFDAVPSADIYAKRAFTDTPVDALIGTVEFGYDDDYGRSAGYVMRGSDVTGEKNNFASEFYLPVWRIDMMELFQRTTSGWEGIAYKNPTNRRQRIGFIHRSTFGEMRLSTKFFAEPGEEVLRTLDDLGVGSLGGGVVTFTVTDAVTGQPSLGDMTYMIGDLPDDIMGSSVLGADTVPTVHDKSKYLSGSVIFTPQKSSLLYLMNPNETPAFVHILLHEPYGPGITNNFSGGITLPPQGSFFVDTRSMIPSYGFEGNIKIFADAGVLGTVINYDNLSVKDMNNVAAVTLQPMNYPSSSYGVRSIDCNGNLEECVAEVGKQFNMVVDWAEFVGLNGVGKVELYLDGERIVETDGENRVQGFSLFSTIFEQAGEHDLEVLIYGADDNEIVDGRAQRKIKILENLSIIEAFTFYDRNGTEIPYGPGVDVSQLLIEQNDTIRAVGRIKVTTPNADNVVFYFSDRDPQFSIMLDENGEARIDKQIVLRDTDRDYDLRFTVRDGNFFLASVNKGMVWEDVKEEQDYSWGQSRNRVIYDNRVAIAEIMDRNMVPSNGASYDRDDYIAIIENFYHPTTGFAVGTDLFDRAPANTFQFRGATAAAQFYDATENDVADLLSIINNN